MADSLAQQLERPLSKLHHLALSIFLVFIVGFNRFVGNGFDHLHNLLRLADQVDELLVLGLQKLKESPDGDMLEGRVATRQEALKITVNAAVWLIPVLNKDRIVANCSESVFMPVLRRRMTYPLMTGCRVPQHYCLVLRCSLMQ